MINCDWFTLNKAINLAIEKPFDVDLNGKHLPDCLTFFPDDNLACKKSILRQTINLDLIFLLCEYTFFFTLIGLLANEKERQRVRKHKMHFEAKCFYFIIQYLIFNEIWFTCSGWKCWNCYFFELLHINSHLNKSIEI